MATDAAVAVGAAVLGGDGDDDDGGGDDLELLNWGQLCQLTLSQVSWKKMTNKS